MGQRANLFEEARNTINVLKSKAASRHTYDKNFPMSIMRVTRRHLYTVSHQLIDAFEKNRYISIPALMKRYYKLNELHISQLTRYLRMCTTSQDQPLSQVQALSQRESQPPEMHLCQTEDLMKNY